MSEVIVRERYLKNGKKVYEYCFELAHEGGKRRRRTKSGFATKREARAAGRQALYEYENVGEVVVDNNISYSDFLDFWIENDCKNTCKEQTIKGYEKKIKLYIKPELGAYRIKSINKDNLQAFITDLYNDGFSVNTVTSIKGLLTKSFNFAVDRNYIPASPAVNLVIPKNKQPDRPTRFKQHIFLEKDQVDKIFERFPKGTSSFIPLKIAYHTGMRPGEVFGLIWDDIDFVNKTITVGVIETSGNSKESRIYFYNQNLEKTATLPLEYASLGSIFYNPVIYEDELYLIPQGKTNVKDEKKVLKIELKSGNQKIYEINQLAMNSICVNDNSNGHYDASHGWI